MNHGFAFGEHIKTEKVKRRRYDDEGGDPPLRSRGFLLPVVLGIITVLLLGKLFTLQLVQGDTYKKLADSNKTRTQIIHAPRGVIFDRNGLPLVYNTPGFLQTIRDSSGTVLKSKHLSKDEALKLIAKEDRSVEIAILREYPYKEATSHVLGYTGQISEEEIKSFEFKDYLANDWIGKNGIERQYEHVLKGIDGKRLIEVDALGKPMRPLGQTDPMPGQNITLTIDAKLQEKVYQVTKDVRKGAVVVSTPDGQILAMVSQPTYDSNLFTLDETYKAASDSAYQTIESMLLDSENQPLLDRAIGGTYPPGSTFKIVTAVSGLEHNVIDGDFHITDTGILKVGEFSFANWYFTQYGRTDGEVNVIKALSRSNDIYFYKLGQMLGVDKLSETARKFGLGEKLGIDLGGEMKGLVPSKKWKKETLNEDWYLGDNYHYGIGQGYLLTTPLQVNSWTQTVANGGTFYQPRLLKNQQANVKNKELLSKETLSLVREGMLDSCREGGVAFPFFGYSVKNPSLKSKIDGKDFFEAKPATGSAVTKDSVGVSVACKTGTAQHGGEDTKPHAWITLFAPAYNPEVVVTVLVESAGEGSSVAGPIAKKVLDAYFSEK
jgi:penicillin-binding protein 2